MQRLEGELLYSASDLNDYLDCTRLSELEALVARGRAQRPDWEDPQAGLLRRKGDEHEQRYLERMRADRPECVVEFSRPVRTLEGYRAAERQTLEAMRRGVPFIYQATFFDGRFVGHADFLRRVEEPSDLGPYSYEALDTKLGLTPRPYYLIQLCNYSEHIARLQGRMPRFGHVVLGDCEERAFRLNDYLAYYRHLKEAFLRFVADDRLDLIAQPRVYPWECKHCASCAWNAACDGQRRDDDHLSLVAGIRRDQIVKLQGGGIASVMALARAAEGARPAGMSPETFAKLQRQASLQVRARERGSPIYELIQHVPPLGFGLMPPPARGDVFFDMEGDPLYEPGRSLEYLFGCWLPDDDPAFRAFWALDRDEERRAFESFIDFVTARRAAYPQLHVYHYAGYEKAALRRLAAQHATREAEVDDLLRNEVLVDLYAVVRQALAISEERYGLKNLERFYELARATDVKKGDQSIVTFERWLLEKDRQLLDDIERYNRDDCRSTYLLREWLLARRTEATAAFGELPFHAAKAPDAPCHAEFTQGCGICARRQADEREAARRSGVERALLDDARPNARLLANLMAYHRREEKPAWWAFFDRCENLDQLLEFDKEAIAGLTLAQDEAPRSVDRSRAYVYDFPEQPHRLSPGDGVVNPRTRAQAGTILSFDEERSRLVLKTTAPIEAARAIAELIPSRPITADPQRDALARIGAAFLNGDLARVYPATDDLLARRDPRGAFGGGRLQPEQVTAASLSEAIRALDRSYLFVQGPPGSGKTAIGAAAICDLLAGGKRVAVTSTSHKAIHNLLHRVESGMQARGKTFRGFYKHSSTNAGSAYASKLASAFIQSTGSHEPLERNEHQLAGGTAWLLAREALTGTFDYLFIDEAGQVSLADALATSLCARNVVLLGDPSQLAQVSQASHPFHAGDSVLEHLLGDAQTVAPHRGIFLDVSYRMQPEICAFVSDAMYEGRLHAAAPAGRHRVIARGREYAGLYFVGLEHEGNGSSSAEEADEIVRRILMLRGGVVLDSDPRSPEGTTRPLTDRDVIVVSPYNAQRQLILAKLRDAGIDVDPGSGVRVGTVDKFQGQEAAVVFYSMAASSGEDIPRNVEFLFERNRFNVAISRARAASILLCSRRLLDIRCRTPEEMALANLLCAFAQRAQSELPVAELAV
jgi:predicted RecB family nuclease